MNDTSPLFYLFSLQVVCERHAHEHFGWHLNKREQVLRQMPVGPDGRLWSFHLDSFLVPDTDSLRLYDRNGQLRLTRAEAEAEAKYAAIR